MISINIYDENNSIDTSSFVIRKKISDTIAKYLLDHWDKCVETEEQINIINNKDIKSTLFKICL